MSKLLFVSHIEFIRCKLSLVFAHINEFSASDSDQLCSELVQQQSGALCVRLPRLFRHCVADRLNSIPAAPLIVTIDASNAHRVTCLHAGR